jgi:hypothetical protein
MTMDLLLLLVSHEAQLDCFMLSAYFKLYLLARYPPSRFALVIAESEFAEFEIGRER